MKSFAMFRKRRALGGACLAGSLASAIAAPTFPGGNLRMVLPTAVGGTTDLVARLLDQQLNRRTGLQVLVDNKEIADWSGETGDDNLLMFQA